MRGEKKIEIRARKKIGVLWGAMERDISIYIVLLRCVILTFQYLDITHLSFKLKYNVTQLYLGRTLTPASQKYEPPNYYGTHFEI